MPEGESHTDEAAQQGALRPNSLRSLPQRTYRLRVLGMGLAFLPLAAVLHELQPHWAAWIWIVFSGLLWPHLAYLLARRSADPFRAELRNFVVDSMLAGSWVPLMQFNLLPSALLLSVVTADKVNAGIRGLWLRSLPGLAAAILVGGLLTGFAFQPVSSMTVVVACLPILIIHTLAVSLSSYKLVRRVQRQNLQLQSLSRTDPLTGLDNRRHWETRSSDLLARQHDQPIIATLMLIDIDHFKAVNDRFGHGVGDEVLLQVAALLRANLREDSFIGRLGGDEFVATLPIPAEKAEAAAERLRKAVQQLRFAEQPELRCSVSIGLAPAEPGVSGLREWIEVADRRMYEAKQAGRNRAVGRGGGTAGEHAQGEDAAG